MDETACNYNPIATSDDSSCYNNDLGCGCDMPAPNIGYDCNNVCLSDVDNDGICDNESLVSHGDEFYIPDGNGVSYTSEINVNSFDSLEVLGDDDFVDICIEIEHSYLGDLQLELTAPGGQNVILHSFESGTYNTGGNTWLGNALDNNSDEFPGDCWEYCWSSEPIFGTFVSSLENTMSAPNGENAMIPGYYTPEQSFSNFSGSTANGNWTLTITDNLSIDNGFVCGWNISLNNQLDTCIDIDNNGLCDEIEIVGCMDELAFNYNPEANINDGSCIYYGCTDETACNYNELATDSSDDCIYIENTDYQLGDLVYECYLSFTSQSVCQSPELEEGNYVMELSGTYCFGSCWNGNTSDPAYVFNHPNNPDGTTVTTQYFVWNQPECSSSFNDCTVNSVRPSPDIYNPDHIYYYPFVSLGGVETIYGSDDVAYGDNIDGITVKIYLNTQSNFCATCSGEVDGTGIIIDNDIDNDGVCDEFEIFGCQDETALNFDPDATDDDGSCIAIVEGCTDLNASNYNADANLDDGSCMTNALSLQGILDLNGSGSDIYSGTDGKAIHLVATADIADLSVFGLGVANNGGGSDGVEYTLSGSANAGDDILVYRVGSGSNSESFFADYFGDCFYEFDILVPTGLNFPDGNGDDPVELFENGVVIDFYGDVDGSAISGDPYEDGWTYKQEDGTWLDGGEDCDVEASELYTIESSGCPYPLCNFEIIYGCTDTAAINFNPNATNDDDSCLAIDEGCMDPYAPNYDSTATSSCLGCCLNIQSSLTCENALEIILDSTFQGDPSENVWFEISTDFDDPDILLTWIASGNNLWSEISPIVYSSCGDSTSILNPPILSGGSLYFIEINSLYVDTMTINFSAVPVIYGCLDQFALNFNPEANLQDSCEYQECDGINAQISLSTVEYGAEVYYTLLDDQGEIVNKSNPGDFISNQNYLIENICLQENSTYTMLSFDGYGDGWNGGSYEINLLCGVDTITVAYATPDNGIYISGMGNPEIEDSTIFEVLPCEQYGCKDETALNFDPEANADDGSCIAVVEGCTDSLYLEYDPAANVDNDSCLTLYCGDGLTAVNVEVSGGSYCGERSWNLVLDDSTYFSGSGCNSYDFCMLDGCWVYEMADSYGDGWNGGEAVISSGDLTLLTASLPTDGWTITPEGTNGSEGLAVNADCGVLGCTDETACNYNSSATDDDGSCYNNDLGCGCDSPLPPEGFDCLGICIDSDQDNVCDIQEVSGCQDETACNYNPDATDDDGSCYNNDLGCGCDMPASQEGYNCNGICIDSDQDGTCDFEEIAGCTQAPSSWNVTVTNINHTIMIPDDVILTDVDGESISTAVVGIFFINSYGEYQCAGFGELNGSIEQIAAMGDDSTTDEIDGLTPGEEFLWMISDCNGNITFATAQYSNGSSTFIPNDITFISEINAIPNGPLSQIIELNPGWSMFSTYMIPEDMDISSNLSSIVDQLIIVKDVVGAVYLVQWNFNGIGDLEIGQGYQIKTNEEVSLEIFGNYAFPQDNAISLNSGWNMIGYLRTSPSNIALVMSEINSEGNLIIAKDYNGAAYLPEFDFNGIGNMNPGQGYQIKILNDDILIYLENDLEYKIFDMYKSIKEKNQK